MQPLFPIPQEVEAMEPGTGADVRGQLGLEGGRGRAACECWDPGTGGSGELFAEAGVRDEEDGWVVGGVEVV